MWGGRYFHKKIGAILMRLQFSGVPTMAQSRFSKWLINLGLFG
jgi:hypothetical protein